MKITLEQWQTLVAVVESGGYAKAAAALDKSQAAVSYSMSKMEEQLGVAIFRIEGRKAVLTTAGQALYKQARLLLEKARFTEEIARNYQAGSESRIHLAMEVLFPASMLTAALSAFSEKYPYIRVELHETALSGTTEALHNGKVELAIIAHESAQLVGEHLMPVKLVAVAHPEHPLHQLGRVLTYDDLSCERQIVIRDSGSQKVDAGWLDAQKRWTVTTISTSIHCVKSGLGFAWYPEVIIQRDLSEGLLKPLPLEHGAERYENLYLVLRDGKSAAPHAQYLAEMIRTTVQSACQERKGQKDPS